MKELKTEAPEVYEEFVKGHFVVRTSCNAFTSVSPDLALEHINKLYKGSGGLIGITRNESAMNRWCLITYSLMKLTTKAAALFGLTTTQDYGDEEDDLPSFVYSQLNIDRDCASVNRLLETMRQIHPFEQNSVVPLNIANSDLASEKISSDLKNALSVGHERANEFASRAIEKTEKTSIHDPIHKTNLTTFKTLYSKVSGRPKAKTNETSSLKEQVASLSSIVANTQNGRKLDFKEAMAQEYTKYPTALAQADGQLRIATNKSALFPLLVSEDHYYDEIPTSDEATALIVDGMAFVWSTVKKANCKTFGDYAQLFCTSVGDYVQRHNAARVDVVFDRYRENSIKSTARNRRHNDNTNPRKELQGSHTPFPKNSNHFLLLMKTKRISRTYFQSSCCSTGKRKPTKSLSAVDSMMKQEQNLLSAGTLIIFAPYMKKLTPE